MRSIDIREVIGGALLTGTGLFAAIFSYANYDLGTFSQMGPGMFPLMLGCILVTLGLLVFAGGYAKNGGLPTVEYRSAITILTAILIFSLTIERFGFIPSIFATIMAATLADRKLNLTNRLVLSAALSTLAVLIFTVGFGLPFELVRWTP